MNIGSLSAIFEKKNHHKMNNAASLLEWSKHFSIFDSTPLNGLRGFVALHILLFHSIQDVTLVNIYGDVNLLNHLPMKVSIKNTYLRHRTIASLFQFSCTRSFQVFLAAGPFLSFAEEKIL